jgi:hypothetical protein
LALNRYQQKTPTKSVGVSEYDSNSTGYAITPLIIDYFVHCVAKMRQLMYTNKFFFFDSLLFSAKSMYDGTVEAFSHAAV